jgi:hypothetical protein
MRKLQVLLLSDVTLGYAVPQMILMARSLGELFKAHVTIVEPDMKGRNDLMAVDGITFRRISTRNPPHDPVFQIEYARAINRIYQEIQPDVLVVFNAAVLAPLLLNRERPNLVLYYMLESLDHQYQMGGEHFIEVNRMATQFIDLVIVPERRRFAVDAARINWESLPVVEVLNIGSEVRDRRTLPDRCRFLFAGTLNSHTGFDWLLDERLSHLEIDVAGPTDSAESRQLLDQFLSTGGGSTKRRYFGLIPHHRLLSQLHEYAFRMVFWTATDINTLYASPNKFFESIAYSLPPVSTPHPQMLEVNREYRCSLLSQDFSREEMVACLLDAQRIFDTPGYARLLEGCRRASREKLNWSAQFAKVAKAINALALGLPIERPAGLELSDADHLDEVGA